MRSVWSRLGAGSSTSVTPSAWRPARITAVLTCALTTSRSIRRPVRPPPRITRGASSPSARPSTRAPNARNGRATRPIGRAWSELSPLSTLRNGRPASGPASMRIVVPELPQSMTESGSRSPAAPVPSTATVDGSESFTRTPSCSSAPRVRCTSSPSARPRMVLRPDASAADSRARCEIPLSPGTRTVPRSGRGPAIVISAAIIVSRLSFST